MDHGIISEQILHKACIQIFGEDLVFISPEMKTDAGKMLELTDVLIILDKYLITIQSKSLALTSSEIDDIKFGRIVKRYDHAKGQIKRTLSAFERKNPVTLKTCFGKNLFLPWENIKEIISVITLNINDEEYSDAEYRFQFPLKIENDTNTVVHTFMLRDFYNLITELTTGGDFLGYLKEREYLSSKTLQNYTNELDIIALYVSQYDFIEKAHENQYDTIIISPGLWESYREEHKEKIKERDKKKFAFSVRELFIKELRTSIDYTIEIAGIDLNLMTKQYFHLIGIFALMSRVESVCITELFMKKLESTKTEMFRYFIFPKNECAILFLILNEPNRELRKEKLIAFTGHAAKYLTTNPKFNRLQEIIGIATEGQQLQGRSLDILNAPLEEALKLVDHNIDFELFRDVDSGRVDEWNM